MATTCCHSPFKPTTSIPRSASSSSSPKLLRRPFLVKCSVKPSEPDPVFASVRSFAPATVANLGPGFDFLGCAVDGIGDHVTVRVDPQ
ncbi:hypothetical protein CRG98_003832, partial [Punica granatum]